jgi:hypothetical protein
MAVPPMLKRSRIAAPLAWMAALAMLLVSEAAYWPPWERASRSPTHGWPRFTKP